VTTDEAVVGVDLKGLMCMSEPIYGSGAAGYDAMFAHVTATYLPALFEAAQIASGHRVLDVATGTGATAREAAKVVGPTGEVVAGDISAAMLDVAKQSSDNAGITFEQFDGHNLPYADARFDRVICQLGLAFFDDPARGLAEFWRVLKPGGRAAVIVNSTPERSLFTRIGSVIGKHVPDKAERPNRYASIRTPDRLHALLVGAGFDDVQVRGLPMPFSFDSFDHYFAGTEAGAASSGQEFVKLTPALRHTVREEVRRSFPDEGLRKPFIVETEMLVGSGKK
jgi:SAM-dependent methyltransferase